MKVSASSFVPRLSNLSLAVLQGFGYTLLFTSSAYSVNANAAKTNVLDPNIFSSTLPAGNYSTPAGSIPSTKKTNQKNTSTKNSSNKSTSKSPTKKPNTSLTYPKNHPPIDYSNNYPNSNYLNNSNSNSNDYQNINPNPTEPTPENLPASDEYHYDDFVPKNGIPPKAEIPSKTTEDVTKSSARSTIDSPQLVAGSARTRPNFTPTPKQQASLDRLKQYYQPKPAAMLNNTASPTALNTQPMCVGTWVYPTNKYQQKQNLANAQQSQQNQLANADKKNPNSNYPTYAEADYGYYDNDNYAELAGNVLVNQGSQQIAADKVVVNLQDGIAAAQGNVSLVDASNYDANANSNALDNNDNLSSSLTANNTKKKLGIKGGLITMADEIAYQTNNSKATAKDVAFASVPLQAHGYAKQLNQVDESHFEIQDVMLTTCPPENPTWQINAKNIDVDSDTGRGKAYNATLKVKNTPVFYLPYFNFPIDSRRSSGVLLPRAGFSSDGGLNVQVPYYFNLAPNYDATVTPTIFTNKNPMLTGEFRYLTPQYGHGSLTASYLPSDRQYDDKDRSSVFFEHKWQSPRYPTLSAEAVYQHVSDSAYFDDFDTLGIANNPLNLPRRLQATYFDDNFTALAKVESFQTLDDDLSDDQDILDKDKPYQRLPQLSLSYKLPWIKQFDVTGVSDFAYFKRPIHDGSAPEQSGGRLYNKINLSKSFERPWGYVMPSVALQHLYTQYDEETVLANGISDKNKSKSVFVPQVGLDAGLNFFKAGSPFGKYDSTLGGYQVLSPRVKYLYSPYEDQSGMPNFNTRVASLNYPQLFEDSWFLGYDRLPDNNHVTPALNYRYIDGNGLTRLDASVGQQFYLNDIKVRLDNDTKPLTLNTSGTVVQLSGQPKPNFWTDFDGAVTDSGDLGYYNLQMRYQPNTRSLYNVGFIKRNDYPLWGQKDLSAITGSAIFPINDNWRFLGAAQYDNKLSRFSDVLVGLDYESCCYGFSVYGRRYYNALDGKSNQAIMAELSLSGIANKREGRLASLINDRVLGYNQLNRF